MPINTLQYDFHASFQGATVFLPVEGPRGRVSRGRMSEMGGALRKALQGDASPYPVAVFMQGSRYAEDEVRLAECLVDQIGLILIAPATHEIGNRP